MASPAPPVFISYAREDIAFAREVRDWLVQQGQQPWMDLFDIPAGARWPDEIDRALRSAEAVIGLLSRASIASENVKNEWDWAIANDRRLILLLVEPCEIPFHYVSRSHIDFSTDPGEGFRLLDQQLAATRIHTAANERDGPAAETEGHALVGREREWEVLQERLAMALAGNGSLVLVSGEAGIGKTALIEDAAREAARQGMLVLSGGCYDLTITPPYGPWVDVLRAYPALPGLPHVPLYLRESASLEQVGSQEQLFRIIAGFLGEVAAARPLLLVLEDLHWSDHASIELLRYLARQLAGQRVLMIASYRDDELTRSHPLFATLPLLIREGRAERLELQPLDAQALRRLVESQYPLSSDEIQTLGSYLLQHTEGNPLFAAELLRSLEQERVLSESEQGWRLGELDVIVPPPLIVQMIERHLAALDAATREALEIAAVLGQEITLDLWRELSRLADEALSIVIEQALVARFVEPHGASGLRFRHALIREVLYQGMIFPRRRQVHRRAAESLVETGSPDPDLVASHFQRAGDERAVHWLIEAGQRAAGAWAGLAARERYQAALQLVENDHAMRDECGWLLVRLAMVTRDIAAREGLAHAEAARRLAEETGDEALAAWALWIFGQGRCYVGENGLPEMRQGLAALRRLPQTAFDRLPPRFQRFDLHYVESSLIIMQALFGYYREALAAADRFLNALPLPGNELLWLEWGHAEAARANALSALGEPEAASEAFQRTKEAYRKGGSAWYVALAATGELQYATLAYQADQPAKRQRQSAEIEALWAEASGITSAIPPRFGLLPLLVVEGAWADAREIAAPFANEDLMFLDPALFALGMIARAQGERELAWNQVEVGLPDAFDTEPGSHGAAFKVELYRLAANLALDDERLEIARRWIEAHDRWLAWSGSIQGWAEAQLLWARFHQTAGDARQARHHAGQALHLASDPRQPLALIAAHRFLGCLDTLDRQHDAARDHIDTALRLSEACAAPYEEALTLLALAELGAATGKVDEAWTQLDRARAICIRLEAKPALQRATAIAARLAVRRGKPVYPAGLTPREVDVLRLVADGLTDTGVAERLFVSPRTVNTHLTSIYNKLGVNSRVEAARFAVEQGLADSSSR